MSAKVTVRDFVQSLARKTGRGEEDMTLFLKELQAVVEQGLEDDGIVKMSGLGTFRLVWNEPRGSVNVQTGEAMEIAGHYKVSFTPDAALRDFVNEPLAHLEAVELADGEPVAEDAGKDDYELPMQKLADQAEALKGMLSDIQGVPLFTATEETAVKEWAFETEETEEVRAAEEPAEDEAEDDESAGDTSGDAIETEVQEESGETAYDITDTAEVTESVAEGSVEQRGDEEEVKEEGAERLYSAREMAKEAAPQRRRGGRRWIYAVAAAVAVAAIGCVALFFVNVKDDVAEVATDDMVVTAAEPVEAPVEEAEMGGVPQVLTEVAEEEVREDTAEAAERVQAEPVTVAQVKSSAGIEIFDRERRYTEFSDTVELAAGSRLVWEAYKQWGDKLFWPYIYEANMDHISNPNDVPAGTLLRIPVLPAELTDRKNPECVEYARELHRYYTRRR